MPVAFIAVGAMFLIAAVRGTLTTDKNGNPGLLNLLESDFVPSNGQVGFLIWLASLWIIGALGYIPGFKPIANALLFLVLLVLFLSNSRQGAGGGLFAEFNQAIRQSPSNTNTATMTALNSEPFSVVGSAPLEAMQPMQPMASSNPYVF